MGCIVSDVDLALYLLKRYTYFVLLVVSVDDILFVSNSETEVKEVTGEVETFYEIRIMCDMEKFWGSQLKFWRHFETP